MFGAIFAVSAIVSASIYFWGALGPLAFLGAAAFYLTYRSALKHIRSHPTTGDN